MKNKQLLKDFIKFLRKENIYKNYIEGLKRGESYRANEASVRECDELIWLVKTIKFYPEKLIEDAFGWYSHSYVDWFTIDEKWKDFVYNKSHKEF